MDEIYALFTDTTVITNVVSIVGAALLALVINIIKKSVAALNTEKVNYQRMDEIATLVYNSARMYKNALINSNLTADAKIQAMTDYQAIEALYGSYVAKYVTATEVAPTAAPAPTLSPAVTTTVATATAALGAIVTDKVVDQLEQLRTQLDSTR